MDIAKCMWKNETPNHTIDTVINRVEGRRPPKEGDPQKHTIKRERERERARETDTHTSTHTHTYT
jgi:hypothetical protein